jgi:hypothetical protein
MYNSGKFIRDG